MNKLTLFTFLIIYLISQIQLSQAQCHMDDWAVLKALYESTDGDNWTDRTGWDVLIDKQNSPPVNCNLESLYGITLVNGRVHNLTLSSNQLNGNIPSEIGNLTNLYYLSMLNNQLTGNIPSELGSLSNLTTLWLGNNQLNGSIPAELDNLSNLTTLLLINNQLTGNIPAELGNLTNLTGLNISSNYISGCFPDNLTSLCTQLTTQDFGNNFAASWEDFCNTAAGICDLGETYDILVPTNYSGYVEVTATLTDINQYSLQNNNAIVYDYSTCPDYTNLGNCNPVSGFDNLSANEAFWAVSKAAAYFSTYHNIPIYPVNLIVNDTETPNGAKYNPNHNTIILGKGNGIERNAMTAPDIVGHEYTHAILHANKNLMNYGISGALNESYADIFAELIEYFCYGYNDDWIYGKQVVENMVDNYAGFRNLSTPKDNTMQYKLPDTYEGEHWINIDNVCFHIDYCGIHTNSGVHSYWFYLLANGGSGINDNGDSYSVNGIGTEKAADIAFKNLINYLNPNSTFNDAREGSIYIASTEYSNEPTVLASTIEAWNAVGVYEVIKNPLKFRIDNAIQIDAANMDNEIPIQFDLWIDSLGMDISADELCFSLHLPATHQNLTIKTVYEPLIDDELSVTETSGEMNICINRVNEGDVKRSKIYAKIASRSLIIQFGVCIISDNLKGEPSTLEPIEISGFTKTGFGEVISFKPADLPFGFDYSEFNNDPQNMLEISLTLDHKNCRALGNIAIEVLNNYIIGVSPYTYTLKNAGIINEIVISGTTYQFYNLEEGIYELKVEDSNNNRVSKKFKIDFTGEPDGSICCAENLTIPPGFIDGVFNANSTVQFSKGALISEGVFEICK